jgi:UDP-N-acetylglucosamine:LPS N-acetylglucosamine transferase
MKLERVIISGGGTGGHIFPPWPLQMKLEKGIPMPKFCLWVRRAVWKWKKFRLPGTK